MGYESCRRRQKREYEIKQKESQKFGNCRRVYRIGGVYSRTSQYHADSEQWAFIDGRRLEYGVGFAGDDPSRGDDSAIVGYYDAEGQWLLVGTKPELATTPGQFEASQFVASW